MHLINPIIFSLLSTTALALPATNQSHARTALDKRGKEGWLGSFVSNDCSGPVSTNSISNLKEDQCYTWSPSSQYHHIGINYGSGALGQLHSVRFYTDGHCKSPHGGSLGAGYIHQDDSGKGMTCTTDCRDAKSFRAMSDPTWEWQFQEPTY